MLFRSQPKAGDFLRQLILLRHATRASSFDSDAALSTLGHAQAASAPLLFEAGAEVPSDLDKVPAKPDQVFSSPKLRARQTVMPLVQALGISNQIDDRLDERKNDESSVEFEERIRSFLRFIDGSTQTILACTHMDWLEAVLPLMDSNLNDRELLQPWAAGEFRCFVWTPEGHLRLAHCEVLRANS